MTAEELHHELRNVIQGAGPTTSKRIIAVLNSAVEFLETPQPTPHLTATQADFKILAAQCAAELEDALALKVGVMDSESKAAAVTGQQLGAMQAVAARLREA